MSRSALAMAYGSLLGQLDEELETSFDPSSPDAGFVRFVYHVADEPLPEAVGAPEEPVVVAQTMHAPALAGIGYHLARGVGQESRQHWLDAVDRLSARDAFPTDRQSFTYRPIELLGIAAGVASTVDAGHSLHKWLGTILRRLATERPSEAWAVLLRSAAARQLDMDYSVPAGAGYSLDSLSLPELALKRWVEGSVSGSDTTQDIDRALLERALTESVPRLDICRAAVLHHSLRDAVARSVESEIERSWQVGRRRRDAEQLVEGLCRRFHIFVEQLGKRHADRNTVAVNDEYDVQDLMHAILRLHFDDVRPEEVAPSLAGKSSRPDFLLKHQQLGIEVKMTRKGLDQKKVSDELIIDMRRYRTHPDCRSLICFVYDPAGFCHAPDALEHDLSSDEEQGFRTQVIVCPKGT